MSILIKHFREEETILQNYLSRYCLKVYNIAEVRSPVAADETRNNGCCLKSINVETMDKSEKILLSYFQSKQACIFKYLINVLLILLIYFP